MTRDKGSTIVLSLPHGRGNPRNSEGAFVTLADGRIMFAYTRYYGGSWHDGAPARICARYSSDGGRAWTRQDRVLVDNEGRCNVMSVSLLRLADGRMIGLFYLRKNGPLDCRARLRVSRDEGQTWGRPVLCIPAPGYFVVNNDRVVQLRTGRLMVPASYHRCKLARPDPNRMYAGLDSRGIAMFFLSDDGGRTWRESRDWWALSVRSGTGLQEPGVVELKDGRLYAVCRTDRDRQYEMFSDDGGETWTCPKPSSFQAPASPMSIKRIPATGDLLAVWNDRSGRLAPVRDKFLRNSWARTPLVAALSSNEGRSWRRVRLIESDPRRGFCYTALHFTDQAVLMAYCCGGWGSSVLQDLCIRRIELGWLYRD